MWRRNLYAVWLAQILSVTGFGFVLPFIPFYIQELGVTDPDQLRLWTGLLSSGPALTMALMAPVWGMVADRWGKKPMMLRAMLFGAIILSLMSTTRTVQAVLILRLCQGLLTGTVTASAALVASGTPKDRLGYALGMLSSSTFIGISIGPMVGGLVGEWSGYRTSFLVGGAMLAVGFLLVLFFVNESDTEGAAVSEVATPLAPETIEDSHRRKGRLAGLITAPMLGLFSLILVLRFVRSLPVPFLPLFIQEIRGQLSGSASATGLISAGRGLVTAVAAITITRLGDRHSRLALVGVLVAIAGALSLPLFFTRSLWSFAGFLMLSTFFLGGVEPLVQADLSSRVSPHRRGFLFGIQTSISNVGWFAAPLVGSFVSIRFGIPHIFLTLTIALFLTVGLVFVVHRATSARKPARQSWGVNGRPRPRRPRS